jgi:hypothetical protein
MALDLTMFSIQRGFAERTSIRIRSGGIMEKTLEQRPQYPRQEAVLEITLEERAGGGSAPSSQLAQ